MNEQLVLGVSDFVAILNQTLEYAYPQVTIVGELANFRVSKGKWVYFDLKDEQASVRFFGTIYALPGPLEDGMQLQVSGAPRLHPLFGFSVTAQHIQPVGEGAIKKAAELLKAKLTAEGLFDTSRKRSVPYPPQRIGLVTSGESAAYADFIKIVNQRWGGLEIIHADVQVQGEAAPGQIAQAIDRLNSGEELDAIIITRGGGSADDLQAFSNELVVRAVAGSRTPTVVAIGHEIDTSLAELAADLSASTPSNAAELLVPDRQNVADTIKSDIKTLGSSLIFQLARARQAVEQSEKDARQQVLTSISEAHQRLQMSIQVVHGYDPKRILRRGYAWLQNKDGVVRSITQLSAGSVVSLRLHDGSAEAKITNTKKV